MYSNGQFVRVRSIFTPLGWKLINPVLNAMHEHGVQRKDTIPYIGNGIALLRKIFLMCISLILNFPLNYLLELDFLDPRNQIAKYVESFARDGGEGCIFE